MNQEFGGFTLNHRDCVELYDKLGAVFIKHTWNHFTFQDLCLRLTKWVSPHFSSLICSKSFRVPQVFRIFQVPLGPHFSSSIDWSLFWAFWPGQLHQSAWSVLSSPVNPVVNRGSDSELPRVYQPHTSEAYLYYVQYNRLSWVILSQSQLTFAAETSWLTSGQIGQFHK